MDPVLPATAGGWAFGHEFVRQNVHAVAWAVQELGLWGWLRTYEGHLHHKPLEVQTQ